MQKILAIVSLIVLSCSPVQAMTWNSEAFRYNKGLWPTLHHDVHNSDHMPVNLGSFCSLTGFEERAWVLREQDHPSVVLTVEALGSYDGKDIAFITTGKTHQPNLHAYDTSDGSELWHAAPPDAAVPGPGACAMTSMALLDDQGNLFISDCQYLFRYPAAGTPGLDGEMAWDWRRAMPGLRCWNAADGLWYPALDPMAGTCRSKPFVTLFMTRAVAGKSCIGGISTEGGVYIFDPDTGDLLAETMLDDSAAVDAADWTPDGPCVVDDYVAKDDPMVYDITPGASDGLTPFGIWSTGRVPETNEPDKDYFMDPCQLSGYFNANTAGGGGMVINTPAVIPDPDNPAVSRIYVNGSQSSFLADYDLTPTAADAVVYRIDFDSTAAWDDRLTVLNHVRGKDGRLRYRGRMVNGENSLSSPTVAPTEKWLISGDNQGNLYCFSAENGDPAWQEEIGSLLGSPTVVQRTEAGGLIHIHTFGDSRLWTFACDAETGDILKKKVVDFRQYLLRSCWRSDDPGYGRHFVNPDGNAYERAAVGASIAVATDDKMVLAYTLGWHDPDRPAAFLIPSHSVLLIVDRASLLTDVPIEAMVDAAYIDTNGTMEQAALIAPGQNGLRALIAYGSQSTSFARFMEVNDRMPEAMKSLYVRPYGGVRMLEPVFAQEPVLLPDLVSGQPSGTSIRWSAAFPGGRRADYRFSAGLTQGPKMNVFKNFSSERSAVWTPLQPGDYTVRVEARDRNSLEDLGWAEAEFAVDSPVPAGNTAVITATDNPLVALFSHGPCPEPCSMRVDFRPEGSTQPYMQTGSVPCSPERGGAVYVAGLRGGVTYECRPVLVTGKDGRTGSPLMFTAADPGLEFPAVEALMEDERPEPFVLMSGFPPTPEPPLPMAVDRSGEPVWFYTDYRTESVVLTSPAPGGNFLLLVADGDVKGQWLKEIDAAGNTVRETSVQLVREQATVLGAITGADTAGAFDHEAVVFPDGNTLVQVSLERTLPGVQPEADVVLGSLIVRLDRNWDVTWAWNAFDHLDITRPAINQEVCLNTDTFIFPGCPPLFTASRAADWIHGNRIAPSDTDGHFIYSMRNQDWVVKIDYRNGAGSGNVLWRLGEDGDFTTTDPDAYPWFSHQHGAQYIDTDTLIVMDNGNTRCRDKGDACFSRGQILLLDEAAQSVVFPVNTDLGVFSAALGNGHAMPDGSSVFTAGMADGLTGSVGRVIGLDPDGSRQFVMQAQMNIYRAWRMISLSIPPWDGI